MLTLVLFTQDAGPGLIHDLEALDRAMAPDIDMVVIDTGSVDDTLTHLRIFCEHRPVRLIQTEASDMDGAARVALARAQTHSPYMLILQPKDRVDPVAIKALSMQLDRQRPDVMVLGQQFWIGEPGAVVPAPDVVRADQIDEDPQADDLLDLRPDLARVLVHADLVKDPVPTNDPAHDWPQWRDLMGHTGRFGFFRDAVCAVPLPHVNTVSAIAMAQDAVSLGWANDTLRLADPAQADELIAGLTDLSTRIPPDQRDHAPAPLGPILQALAAKDQATALAHLALTFAARDRLCTQALQGVVMQLRRDLDLALPGPEYLRRLYDRIRPQ
jgi:hypothetical protein